MFAVPSPNHPSSARRCSPLVEHNTLWKTTLSRRSRSSMQQQQRHDADGFWVAQPYSPLLRQIPDVGQTRPGPVLKPSPFAPSNSKERTVVSLDAVEKELRKLVSEEVPSGNPAEQRQIPGVLLEQSPNQKPALAPRYRRLEGPCSSPPTTDLPPPQRVRTSDDSSASTMCGYDRGVRWRTRCGSTSRAVPSTPPSSPQITGPEPVGSNPFLHQKPLPPLPRKARSGTSSSSSSVTLRVFPPSPASGAGRPSAAGSWDKGGCGDGLPSPMAVCFSPTAVDFKEPVSFFDEDDDEKTGLVEYVKCKLQMGRWTVERPSPARKGRLHNIAQGWKKMFCCFTLACD